MDEYITAKEAAEKWNLGTRRVQHMCANGQIPGVTKFGSIWAVPATAEKPADGRVKTGKYKDWRRRKSVE